MGDASPVAGCPAPAFAVTSVKSAISMVTMSALRKGWIGY
jgi:hypothetical protein